jgi:hypothetical protein
LRFRAPLTKKTHLMPDLDEALDEFLAVLGSLFTYVSMPVGL